jgi:hypothetical protein
MVVIVPYLYTLWSKIQRKRTHIKNFEVSENSQLGRHNISVPIVQAETKIISLAHLYDNVGTSLVVQNSATQSLQIIHESHVISLE